MRGIYRSVKIWLRDTLSPLRPIYDAWMRVIAGFSWLLTRVVLTVAFFTIFSLYGVILRLIGKDPMNRTLEKSESTYWRENTNQNDDLDDFKTQY